MRHNHFDFAQCCSSSWRTVVRLCQGWRQFFIAPRCVYSTSWPRNTCILTFQCHESLSNFNRKINRLVFDAIQTVLKLSAAIKCFAKCQFSKDKQRSINRLLCIPVNLWVWRYFSDLHNVSILSRIFQRSHTGSANPWDKFWWYFSIAARCTPDCNIASYQKGSKSLRSYQKLSAINCMLLKCNLTALMRCYVYTAVVQKNLKTSKASFWN